ncbi:DERM-like protein, partial [Mya arenaria]
IDSSVIVPTTHTKPGPAPTQKASASVADAQDTSAYYNALDGHFKFKWGNYKQAIYAIYSEHNNKAEDRQFDFGCRDVVTNMDGLQTYCYWSGFINDYDKPVNYQCPGNRYVNGIDSYHNNLMEDRKWSFLCCSLSDVHMADCSLTHYTNDFDGIQNFQAGTGEVMTGMDSYHNNRHE